LKRRTLANTGLELSELGFGGGAIGGLYRAVKRDTAIATMQAAWDADIRYFDTAPFYGFGLSERRVGDFLRDKEGYVLSTKVGKLLKPVGDDRIPDHGFIDPLPFTVDFDYSHDAIMRSLEFSLARLGLSRVDILYVHDLEVRSLGEGAYADHLWQFLDGGVRALEELKKAGVIGAYGLGLNEVQACLNVLERVPMDCLLLAGRYTLLDRSAEEKLLPLCAKDGTSIVVGGVFNSGILATGAVPGAYYQYGEAPPDIVRRVDALQEIAERAGADLPGAALNFPLRNPLVSSVLIGTANPKSIRRNVAGLDTTVTERAWREFDQIALLSSAGE